MRRALLLLAAITSLGACANTAAMRTLAARTSTQVATQEALMNNFVSAQRTLNQGAAVTVDDLNGQGAAQRAKTALLLRAWDIAGKGDLISAQANVTKVQASDIVASLAVAQTTPPVLDDGGAGTSLEKASSAFSALAKKPGFLDQAREVFASAGAVYEAAQKLEKAQKSAAPSKLATVPTSPPNPPSKPGP